MTSPTALQPRDASCVAAFLCVDVEPDHLRLPKRGGPVSWSGFDAMAELAERLRSELHDVSGQAPRFGWYLRMDPQISATHGTPDHVATRFPGRIERFARAGDVFGLHVHPLRWSDEDDVWVHDFVDAGWIRHCVESSAEAFRGVFGELPRRHRFGTRFLNNELVALLEDAGVRVDLTMEPGYTSSTGSHEVPIRGTLPDFTRVPREPYRPAHRDYRRRDDETGRELVLVPQSSHTRRDKPRLWRAARFVRRGFRTRPLPLNPWRSWPSAQQYWDLIASELDAMRTPYLALAVRTDPPGSDVAGRARTWLESLPRHELARRLRFVDPLEAAASMTSRSPATDPARPGTPTGLGSR